MVKAIVLATTATISARKRFQECESDKNCDFGSACIKNDNEQRCKCTQVFNCFLYGNKEKEHQDQSFSCVLYDDNYFNQFDEKHPPTLHEFNNYCEIAEHHCKIQNSPSFKVLKSEQCDLIYEEFNPLG